MIILMKVIKRDGREVKFDKSKIFNAVSKAVIEVDGEINQSSIDLCNKIANEIENIKVDKLSVEEIQDMVEELLASSDRKDIAKAYIRYRYDREKSRAVMNDLETRYKQICKLIRGQDEDSKKENSNKDTRITPTMRDYIAGFTCRRMATDIILPPDIVEAHNKGEIHYHDTDYSPLMPMPNCCLINLEDMLQNGTVMSETLIEKPKSLRTGCTVTTQIVTQVANSQYGFKLPY